LNYFNYFTEIEDAFVRRRGKHLFLSPLDWALMETWKSQEVPLHIVLRGIEKSFDSFEAKPRKRSVKSLLYCQEEVEAQFAEWLESRVGANTESEVAAVAENNDRNPFSSVAVKEHLIDKRNQLTKTAELLGPEENELAEAMLRVTRILADLEEEINNSPSIETRKLEDSLTGLERLLNEAMLSNSGPELDQLKAEIKAQLKPYRAQMEKNAYQQTFDNLLLKRVRERFNVPRLSLFYL
jgi:hypothetical protein